MPKFYATGSKVVKQTVNGEKVTSTVNVVIDNLPETRVGAVNEANRIAKVQKITLDGVYLVNGTNYGGGTMTKNAKARKALRGGKNKK